MINNKKLLIERLSLSGLFFIINLCLPAHAGYQQQAQGERSGRNRVNASGSRGCPFAQGELYLETDSSKSLSVNPQFPQIFLYVTASPNKEIAQQTVKISLVDQQNQNTVFTQEYFVVGGKTLQVKPNLPIERPLILTAGLICNPQRPSTTKSLRILVTPNAT